MIIELPIGKSFYKLSCEEEEKEKLVHLASQLNQRLDQLSVYIKNVDEKTLLAICALTIEEELQQKNEFLEEGEGGNESNEINDQYMYDSASKIMENIAEHIENLTKKTQNY